MAGFRWMLKLNNAALILMETNIKERVLIRGPDWEKKGDKCK